MAKYYENFYCLIAMFIIASIIVIEVMITPNLWDFTKSIGYMTPREDQNQNSALQANVTHVLILAYPRTGSTYTGEMLSLGSNTFYIYEPSFEFSKTFGIKSITRSAGILEKLFNCEYDTINSLTVGRKFHHPLHSFYPKHKLIQNNQATNVSYLVRKDCLDSKFRIIKTIRYNMWIAKQLLNDFPKLNIKIIHLVRDPRASLYSLEGQADFRHTNQTPDYWCSIMRENLQVGDTLPKEKYFKIRYEDIVNNTLKSAVEMYNFIGKPIGRQLALHIAEHSKADIFYKDPDISYYSTFRKANFNPSKWMKFKNNSTWKLLIHKYCEDILKLLKYKP